MSNWQIGRRVATCSACEKEFQDGDALYSLLRVGENGLERADLCLVCHGEVALREPLFWWRTHHHVEQRRGLQLDLGAIEALFVALDPYGKTESDADATSGVVPGGSGAERLLELRYLLCLILLRKRRFKVTKVARSYRGVDGEFFLVKRPRRDEQLAVAVFDFDGDKIAALREDLQRIFEGADPSELAADGTDVPVEGDEPEPVDSATPD